MTTLVLSTRNRHKIEEIRAILGGDFRCLALDAFSGTPEVIEDADTFAGNAAKKATELAQWIAVRPALPVWGTGGLAETGKVYVLADDSGLEVDALNGAPGVHSARFAALDTGNPGNSKDADNNAKLLRLLAGIPPAQRTGRFRCVIALAELPVTMGETAAPATVRLFVGACEGRILESPRGGAGFGYDPLFVPDGHHETFAELGEEAKNRVSHRARALAKLRQHWQ